MARGGIRYGAGRPGWRRKIEYSLALDVRQIDRRNLLKPGMSFSWHWSDGEGEQIGSISVRVYEEQVELFYRWTPRNGSPQDLQCFLQIERTACHYGGFRPWFLCPDCGRRCAAVYWGARTGRYACRLCLNLAYASEAEDTMDRLWRQQRKVERKLTNAAGEYNYWQKPKGMHQATFDRLRARLYKLEEKKNAEFYIKAKSFLQGI